MMGVRTENAYRVFFNPDVKAIYCISLNHFAPWFLVSVLVFDVPVGADFNFGDFVVQLVVLHLEEFEEIVR